MPLQPDPYAALKALLGSSPDLNDDMPTGMVQSRLGQENQAEEDLRRYENSSTNPHSYSGATPSTFKNLAQTLGASPNFGTAAQQRTDDITSANDKAMQAGFTGDTDIAGPASGGGSQLGEHLYANVGDRSGLNPAQMAGRSATMMEAAKVQAPLLAAREKAQGDILAEREKGAQARQTGAAEFKRTSDFLRPGGQGGPAGAPGAPGQQPINYDAPAPPQSQSWSQYLFGGGPRPQNDLMSALHAASERAKYGVMSTPLAPMIQNESFGNLEQLQAQFPGVRGFSYLLPKLAEHQANFGKGETPDSTYLRLHGMEDILHKLEMEVNDPSTHARMGAHGSLEMTATPAVIQSKIAAIHDTLSRISTAKQQLKQQFPQLADPNQPGGVQGAVPQGQPVTTAGGGRFTRIPE